MSHLWSRCWWNVRRQEKKDVLLAGGWVNSCGKAHQVLGGCCKFQILGPRLAAGLEMELSSFKKAETVRILFQFLAANSTYKMASWSKSPPTSCPKRIFEFHSCNAGVLNTITIDDTLNVLK